MRFSNIVFEGVQVQLSELQGICESILAAGRTRFDLAVGIVSRIRDGCFEVFASDSDTGIPQAGDRYDLQSVYCRQGIDGGSTVAIVAIEQVPGMRLDPLYELIPCETCISSPIRVGDRIWGTLNYTSFDIREQPFGAEEITWNEAQAARISAVADRLKV